MSTRTTTKPVWALLAATCAIVRCGGSVEDHLIAADASTDAPPGVEAGYSEGQAPYDAAHDGLPTLDATRDALVDVGSADGALDTNRDTAVADSAVDGSDADASNCVGPVTFDIATEQMAQQICQPPTCKVCVQETDLNALPTKWSAWQIPASCPCPPPKTNGDAMSPASDH